MASLQIPHIVIFPFMAHGHILPLLDLSKILSHHQVKVTIITTPSNAKQITPKIDGFHHITLVLIPFPTIEGLPKGCENASQLPSMDLFFPFVIATKQLHKPFEQILQSMFNSGDLPVCVISDFFLSWTLGICHKFGVPRLVFHGMGILPLVITRTLRFKKLQLKTSSVFDHPNILENLPFSLTPDDIPKDILATNSDPIVELMAEILETEILSWGVIVNSFLMLEGEYVSKLESLFARGVRAWCLGPMFLGEKMNDCEDKNSCMLMKWLDKHANERPKSVIYVSFGTLIKVSDAQLEEVAFGLEESGCPFLLVIRSNTWWAPKGMEERVKTRGLITREFVDQRRVLFHGAIGGFLSHCGWNSVLESMCASVPILGWPSMGDQKINAKYVVGGLGFGVGIVNESIVGDSMGIVSRPEISASVKELMLGEKGRKASDKAAEWGRLAKQAVEDGGSSSEALKMLLQELSKVS